MEFINCTPHALTIEGLGTLAPSGVTPRCAAMRVKVAPVGGVRISSLILGDVTGLPVPVEGVCYVVSTLVLSALKGVRKDVYAPDTGPDAVRENGQIVAVRGLVQ